MQSQACRTLLARSADVEVRFARASLGFREPLGFAFAGRTRRPSLHDLFLLPLCYTFHAIREEMRGRLGHGKFRE